MRMQRLITEMKTRIRRAPPARILEGVDLGPGRLEPGRVYELEPRVAEILIFWGYAERGDNGEFASGEKRRN